MMTVYVDDAQNPYGRMKMAHLMADTTDELLEFAYHLGIKTKWLQNAGTPTEHFDVSQTKRDEAIRLGAKPCPSRALIELVVKPKRKRAKRHVLPTDPTITEWAERAARRLKMLQRIEERNGIVGLYMGSIKDVHVTEPIFCGQCRKEQHYYRDMYEQGDELTCATCRSQSARQHYSEGDTDDEELFKTIRELALEKMVRSLNNQNTIEQEIRRDRR